MWKFIMTFVRQIIISMNSTNQYFKNNRSITHKIYPQTTPLIIFSQQLNPHIKRSFLLFVFISQYWIYYQHLKQPALLPLSMLPLIFFLFALTITQSQFLRNNTWEISSNSTKYNKILSKNSPFGYLQTETGMAQVLLEKDKLILTLIQEPIYEFQYLLGLATTVCMRINFNTITPEHYGKINGIFDLSVCLPQFTTFEPPVKNSIKEMNKYNIVYWPHSKLLITSKKTSISINTAQFSLPSLEILCVGLMVIKILILSVLNKRKKWYQMNATYLMVFFGWQIKVIAIVWFQANMLLEHAEDLSSYTLVKGLLHLLTTLFARMVLEMFKLNRHIQENFWKVLAIGGFFSIAIILSPMTLLHFLLPLAFFFQYQKYSKFSKIDSQVHYSLILLHLTIAIELILRITQFQQWTNLLALAIISFTVLSFLIQVFSAELYQYSQQNNIASPCVLIEFNNKKYCPHCRLKLYQKTQLINEIKERKDLQYDLWQFGVGECGHLFHRECLLNVLRQDKGCPLTYPNANKLSQPKSQKSQYLNSVSTINKTN